MLLIYQSQKNIMEKQPLKVYNVMVLTIGTRVLDMVLSKFREIPLQIQRESFEDALEE